MKASSLDNKLIVKFRAPSNIAFIKYWGKYNRQYPHNPSISMTLSECYTETTVELVKKESHRLVTNFKFHNQLNEVFKTRIENYLSSINDILPWIDDYSFVINTFNSFPHSAGIASSASAFAAIASCLTKLDSYLSDKKFDFNKASILARLGSGSASRSLFSHYAVWGETQYIQTASNDYAIAYKDFHQDFKNVFDTILIIDSNEKKVGSSVGHSLMNGHLFKDLRYEQAKTNLGEIISAMDAGDWDSFGNIIENEALTLHALMMTSSPSYILLSPNSISVINKVRDFREKTKLPLYFTIDAGPNIHLIYPESIKIKVEDFINNELKPLCRENRVIYDSIGSGLIDLNDK